MGDVANCVTVNVEIKSLTEDVDQMISDHIDALKAIKDSTNVKLRVRLEREQFLRSAIPFDKITSTAMNDPILRHRQTSCKSYDPDKVIFKDLEDVKPWDESFLVPEGNFLTQEEIKSVKKGMLEGKLYNMSRTTLKYIYLVLPTVPRYDRGASQRRADMFKYRCPLCPKELSAKSKGLFYAYNHLEQFHTSSLVTCLKCDTPLVTETAVDMHLQECTGIKITQQCLPIEEKTDKVSKKIATVFRKEEYRRIKRQRRNESSSESDSDESENDWYKYKRDRKLKRLKQQENKVYRSIRLKEDRPSRSNGSRPSQIESLEVAGLYYRSLMSGRLISSQANDIALRRKESTRNLNISNPKIFENLESVEPWDVNSLVPFSHEITPEIAASIRKGMLMGQLYCIGRDCFGKIFNAKLLKQSTGPSCLFDCPLCSRSFKQVISVYGHLESIHTNFYAICHKCDRSFQTSSGIYYHSCFADYLKR